MKLVLCVFLCFLSISWSQQKNPQNRAIPGEPDIDFESRIVDLGSIEPGQSIEKRIKIYNRGAKSLEIHKIQASCSCYATMLTEGKIEPGQFKELKIILRSVQGKKIPPRSRVTFRSNDPAEKVSYIETRATEKHYFASSPKTLNLGPVLQGKQKTAKFILFSLDQQPVQIKKITCLDPQVTFSIGAPLTFTNKYPGLPIEVHFDSTGKTLGNFRGVIQVELAHLKEKKFLISLYGTIGGEVFLKAGLRALTIPLYDTGTILNNPGEISLPKNRQLVLHLHERSPQKSLKIVKVIAATGPFDLKPVSHNAGKQIKLIPVLKTGFPSGFFRQKITLLINNETFPVFEFYFQGNLKSHVQLSTKGLYIKAIKATAFKKIISLQPSHESHSKNFDLKNLEIRGKKQLEYFFESKEGGIQLVVKGQAEKTFFERVELVEKISGESIPLQIWVEVLKD